jgi:glycosyltransferase involved in cell wall biosynthesis
VFGAFIIVSYNERVSLKISIIIPAFNEERLIAETLRNVKAAAEVFREHDWETEIIVCDNNSKDKTADLSREAGATVVFEPINQIARARNRGAQEAKGDWLLFVDADSKPSKQLLQEVVEQIESGSCLAGGCIVRLDGDHAIARRLIFIWNFLSRALHLLAGSFIFCEVKAFREIGGFSNELFAGEELDLTKRLKEVARKRDKKIVILHRHPLVTSPRKVELYTLRQHLWFMTKAFLLPGRTMRSREACYIWYDGKR